MVNITTNPLSPVEVGPISLSHPLSLCVCVYCFSSLALPLSSTSLYLCLIANAGSIAAAIDPCVETPSRQEK